MRALTVDDFVQRVRPLPTGCWEWLGGRLPRGYGIFKRRDYAHTFAYETWIGPVPGGLELDHLCRNTWCVNPTHVEPVTHLVNVRRALPVITHCPHGHEYTIENTHWTREGRRCRACRRQYRAARRAKRRGN